MTGPLRRCQHCGEQIPASAYVCSGCGARLDANLTKRPAKVVTGMAAALFVALVLVLVLARFGI